MKHHSCLVRTCYTEKSPKYSAAPLFGFIFLCTLSFWNERIMYKLVLSCCICSKTIGQSINNSTNQQIKNGTLWSFQLERMWVCALPVRCSDFLCLNSNCLYFHFAQLSRHVMLIYHFFPFFLESLIFTKAVLIWFLLYKKWVILQFKITVLVCFNYFLQHDLFLW